MSVLYYSCQGTFRPVPIGGLCGDNPETTKECHKKCVPRSQVCGGSCARNQCLNKEKSSCLEMFVDGNEFGKMLLKDCNGVCIPASKKCRNDCHKTQCWEPKSKKCLDPEHDRPEKHILAGIYSWKNCQGVCKQSSEVCGNSCGDPSMFCWDKNSGKCLSLKERNKVCRKCVICIEIIPS